MASAIAGSVMCHRWPKKPEPAPIVGNQPSPRAKIWTRNSAATKAGIATPTAMIAATADPSRLKAPPRMPRPTPTTTTMIAAYTTRNNVVQMRPPSTVATSVR